MVPTNSTPSGDEIRHEVRVLITWGSTLNNSEMGEVYVVMEPFAYGVQLTEPSGKKEETLSFTVPVPDGVYAENYYIGADVEFTVRANKAEPPMKNLIGGLNLRTSFNYVVPNHGALAQANEMIDKAGTVYSRGLSVAGKILGRVGPSPGPARIWRTLGRSMAYEQAEASGWADTMQESQLDEQALVQGISAFRSDVLSDELPDRKISPCPNAKHHVTLAGPGVSVSRETLTACIEAVDEPTTGKTVTFDGSNSTAPNGNIQSYRWEAEFQGPQGRFDTGSGPTFNVDFPSQGQFRITLTVTGPDGETDTSVRYVSVSKDDEPQLDRTITIDGQQGVGSSRYQIRVTGDIQADAGIGGRDSVVGPGLAKGYVAGGRDRYRFGGEVESVSLTNPVAAAVLVDGEIRNGEDGGSTLDRTIIINGRGSPNEKSDYTIQVTGDIKPENDEIDGTPVGVGSNEGVTGPGRAEGWVGGGADGYRFSGDIQSIELNNPNAAVVTVDGNRFPVGGGNGGNGGDGGGGTSLKRTIVINGRDSPNEKSDYTIQVTGDIKPENDEIDGTPVGVGSNEGVTGPGRAEGKVGGGADGYRFSGDVQSITLSNKSAATVLVDGSIYDPEEEGDGGGDGGGNGDSGNRPPTATIDVSPDPVEKNRAVTFDGSGSSDPDGRITLHQWIVSGPESMVKKGPQFSTTFSKPGNYQVRFQVRDEDGITDETSQSFTVTPIDPVTGGGDGDGEDGDSSNQRPTAVVDISPDPVEKNKGVTFDGSGSSDPDGHIEEYRWSIDGPDSAHGSGQQFSASFSEPGSYTATLAVTDNDGATDQASKSFTVIPFGRGGIGS